VTPEEARSMGRLRPRCFIAVAVARNVGSHRDVEVSSIEAIEPGHDCLSGDEVTWLLKS
jgi:hypothetical protein